MLPRLECLARKSGRDQPACGTVAGTTSADRGETPKENATHDVEAMPRTSGSTRSTFAERDEIIEKGEEVAHNTK